jgi:homoserine dehydrogenase
MKELSFALVGFGNVGQAFAKLLLRKSALLENEFGVRAKVTGIATGRHGIAINPQGIDLKAALQLAENHKPIMLLTPGPYPTDVLEFIKFCPADVLFENSPVNYDTGQPAVDHLKAALARGMHAVTANKGPVVHAYKELTDLAASQGKRFMFESTVMDGAPIFSLFRGSLPGVELKGFHGILNSCTNLILGRMEEGETFDQAVAYAQSVGITETDPAGDIDGWDASVKVAALSTVLMGMPLKPQQVERQGIRGITPQMLADARKDGQRWKLVCSAHRDGDHLVTKVRPERVSSSSPLFSINGTSSYVEFEMDAFPGLGIVEGNPGPDTTAYGLFADLLNIIRGI